MRSLKRLLYPFIVAGAIAAVIGTPAQAAPIDAEVAMQAIEDAGMSTGSVHVDVNDEGVVRLTGMVADGAEGHRMAKTVRRIPGVSKVVDLLQTVPD